MKKLINIRLEEEVWKQAKVAAVKDGKTLQDWLTEAIMGKVRHAHPKQVEIMQSSERRKLYEG